MTFHGQQSTRCSVVKANGIRLKAVDQGLRLKTPAGGHDFAICAICGSLPHTLNARQMPEFAAYVICANCRTRYVRAVMQGFGVLAMWRLGDYRYSQTLTKICFEYTEMKPQ